MSKDPKILKRREFAASLLRAAAAALPGASMLGAAPFFDRANGSASESYDLLIKGGTVVDPSANLHAALDVALKDGKIAAVGANIASKQSRKTISAAGKLVTPGLIDLHVHVYEGATEAGINADRYCIGRGVTTAVDAGSAGYPSIAGLRKYVMNASATRLYALLDIGALGTIVGIKDTLKNLEWVNPELTAKAANANRPTVIGIKARLSRDIAGSNDKEVLRRARQAADATHLPMMLHIGDTDLPLREILESLRPGDIITHSFTPRPNGIVDANGK